MNGDLAQAYDEGAKQHTPAPTMRDVLRSATAAAAGSDIDRWLVSGARLLRDAQARLAKAEHDVATGRARIIADAKLQLDELQRSTREALRQFDAEHQAELARLTEQVQRLIDMREAGEWPASD